MRSAPLLSRLGAMENKLLFHQNLKTSVIPGWFDEPFGQTEFPAQCRGAIAWARLAGA